MLEVSAIIREEQIQNIIMREKPKRIGIQAPDGLIGSVLALSDSIESRYGVETVILFDPSYGICDLSNLDAERIGLDLVINLGHSVNTERVGKYTFLIDVEYDVDFIPVLDKAIAQFKGRLNKVGVLTISNHKAQLDLIIRYLTDRGIKAIRGPGHGVLFGGQVFGCNYYNAKDLVEDVDAFFFYGQSRFHAIGVRLVTRKPTYLLDPFFNVIEDVTSGAELIERKAILSVLKAKEARTVGIIVSLKEGQFFMKQALELKEKLSSFGKKVFLFTMREITAQRLRTIKGVDAFLETACPRVALDDEEFDRPVLSYDQGLALIRLLEGGELGDMFGSPFWV